MLRDQGENFPLIISAGVVQILLPVNTRDPVVRSGAGFGTYEFPFTWAVLPVLLGALVSKLPFSSRLCDSFLHSYKAF